MKRELIEFRNQLQVCMKFNLPVTISHVQDLNRIINGYDAEVKQLKTIISEGWKGKDELTFEKMDSVWVVSEHRKSKESGNVKPSRHEIKQESIDYLWTLIKLTTMTYDKKTSYRSLIPHIINHYGLDITEEEFNGGINRSKSYFPLYYYCIKILEHLGNIKYGGRGTITRLK